MKNLVLFLVFFIGFNSFSQTNEELVMINEINELRTNPKSFIPLIEDYIKLQNEMGKKIKNGDMVMESSDGKTNLEVINRNIKAAKEILLILDTLPTLNALVFSIDMYLVTKSHGLYLEDNNKLTHVGENNSSVSDRFKNTGIKNLTENLINVGIRRNSFKPLIVQFLVDAGVENRGHRKNLLNPESKFVSVYIGKKICVQNFGN